MTTLQSFLTPVCGTARKTPSELATMYLLDRGYTLAQVKASHHDASVLTAEDRKSMERILWGDVPAPPAGPQEVSCLEWAIETLDDPHAPVRLRALAIGLKNENLLGARFVPPVMTESEQAAYAVAEGKASVRPTTIGHGLSYDERRTVNAAVVRAMDASTAEYPFAAGERAGQAALRSVLAERPRIEPEPPVDPWDREYDDASQWPDDTDAFTWGLTDVDPEPTYQDLEWAASLFAAQTALDAGLIPADLPPIMGGSPAPEPRWDDRSGARSRPVRGYSDFDHEAAGHAV